MAGAKVRMGKEHVANRRRNDKVWGRDSSFFIASSCSQITLVWRDLNGDGERQDDETDWGASSQVAFQICIPTGGVPLFPSSDFPQDGGRWPLRPCAWAPINARDRQRIDTALRSSAVQEQLNAMQRQSRCLVLGFDGASRLRLCILGGVDKFEPVSG